jgi:hypothetical protein
MDGGSADHAGAFICRRAGDPALTLALVARIAGPYSALVRALAGSPNYKLPPAPLHKTKKWPVPRDRPSGDSKRVLGE